MLWNGSLLCFKTAIRIKNVLCSSAANLTHTAWCSVSLRPSYATLAEQWDLKVSTKDLVSVTPLRSASLAGVKLASGLSFAPAVERSPQLVQRVIGMAEVHCSITILSTYRGSWEAKCKLQCPWGCSNIYWGLHSLWIQECNNNIVPHPAPFLLQVQEWHSCKSGPLCLTMVCFYSPEPLWQSELLTW